MLNPDGGTAVVAPDTVHADEPVMMPAPRDPRSLFELLYWYGERHGLFGLLGRLQFDDPQPQHVHYSALGRYPDRATSLASGPPYYPHDHLCELLMGGRLPGGPPPSVCQRLCGQAAADICTHSEVRRNGSDEQAEEPLSVDELQHHGADMDQQGSDVAAALASCVGTQVCGQSLHLWTRGADLLPRPRHDPARRPGLHGHP